MGPSKILENFSLMHYNKHNLNRKRMIFDMYNLIINRKTISIFSSTKSVAPIFYLNTFSSEGQKVFEAARTIGCPPFTLAAISDLNWNRDMAPWNSPPVFKNAESFTGGADEYLRLLAEEIVPAAEKELSAAPRWRGIVGYSMGELFALYAAYRTDLFSRVGSVSGSLWYPEIKEYIFSQEPKRWPECVYFSLGDKENKTRNQVLRQVRKNTKEIQTFYQGKGIDTVFEVNPGGHHDHTAERTAAGICWLLSR